MRGGPLALLLEVGKTSALLLKVFSSVIASFGFMIVVLEFGLMTID